MKSCESKVIAQLGNFRVDHCSCGTFSIHTGSISMRLNSTAMIALSTVLNAAALHCEELTECQTEFRTSLEDKPETGIQNLQNFKSDCKEDFH